MAYYSESWADAGETRAWFMSIALNVKNIVMVITVCIAFQWKIMSFEIFLLPIEEEVYTEDS